MISLSLHNQKHIANEMYDCAEESDGIGSNIKWNEPEEILS